MDPANFIISQDQQFHQNRFAKLFSNLDISRSTEKDYTARISCFTTFISGRPITPNTLLAYKKFLAVKSTLSMSSKNKYLTVARIILRELHRLGYLPFDPTLNIKSFRTNKLHKKDGLTTEEVQKIWRFINVLPEDIKSSRLKTWFSLLALQGLRQIEITRLNVEDLFLSSGYAFVVGKGRDDKEKIYLHPFTRRYLSQYLKRSRTASGALFQGLGNRSSTRITTLTIKRQFGVVLGDLGINKTVHGFRHYYITKLLQKFDVRDVRKFSRHRNLEMLIVYDDELDIQQKASETFTCFDDLVDEKIASNVT